MIKEHDMVVLVCDLPERRLKKRQLGVVVMVHDAAGYEVGFVDSNDKTLAVVLLSANFLWPASLEHREVGLERLTKNSAWQAGV